MIIDCISDLHGNYPELEGGDLLIVAGDLTIKDNAQVYFLLWHWLANQNYKKIIVIAGNHDNYLCSSITKILVKTNGARIEYLCDSGTEFEGLKIWGSPWTKTFPGMNPNCKAFTVDTEEELAAKWGLIPDDTDILVTHGPPFMLLDVIDNKTCVGSKSLNETLGLLTPKLHVFGHIHEKGGRKDLFKRGKLVNKDTICVNASHVNERYEPVNKPIRVIL